MEAPRSDKRFSPKGFSTLLVVILLGSTALAFSLWLAGSSGIFLREHLNVPEEESTKALANACAEVALETIRQDEGYSGGDSVSIDDHECSFDVADTGGTNRTITVTATVAPITRTLTITTTDFNPIVIATWVETP